MRFALIGLLTILGPAAGSAAEGKFSNHLSEIEGVRIVHAWTRATNEATARVFMEIENTTNDEVTLVGGAADIAETVRLMAVNFKDPGAYVELRGLPIAGRTAFPLSPHTVFLELAEIDRVLSEGDAFEMQVTLGSIGEVHIHVEVEAHNAGDHSHAGHSH